MEITAKGISYLGMLRHRHLQSLQMAETNSDRRLYADLYWDTANRHHIAQGDYEGAWHRIHVSAQGKLAFTGAHAICKGHVEGEPIAHTASAFAIMQNVHMLFYCLRLAGKVEQLDHLSTSSTINRWDRLSDKGHPVALMLRRERNDVIFATAAQEVDHIVNWANNHRRHNAAA